MNHKKEKKIDGFFCAIGEQYEMKIVLEMKDLEKIKFLIENERNILETAGLNGWDGIMMSVRYGHLDIFKYLYEKVSEKKPINNSYKNPEFRFLDKKNVNFNFESIMSIFRILAWFILQL
jgi:hypothetical protein